MKILIGVDGSPSSLDAVRMVGRLIDPSRDEVAVYFSPMELEKRLLGRSRWIVDGAAAALFEEAWNDLPESRLAAIESLEQLRVIEAGIPIVAGAIDHAARGIDTPKDYTAFVERCLRPSSPPE